MNGKRWMSGIVLLPTLLFASCGTTTTGARPDEMSVKDHRRSAREHDRAAAVHGGEYDPAAIGATHSEAWARRGDFFYEEGSYNPTERHRDEQEEHRRHAAEHRAAAAALEAFEEGRCGDFPETIRAACPLLGQIEAAEDIDDGIRVQFSENVNIEAARAHVDCHIAFAATRGRQGMDHCPLYLPGVEASTLDEHSLDLTIEGRDQLGTLRQRTRAHVIE